MSSRIAHVDDAEGGFGERGLERHDVGGVSLGWAGELPARVSILATWVMYWVRIWASLSPVRR